MWFILSQLTASWTLICRNCLAKPVLRLNLSLFISLHSHKMFMAAALEL